MENTTIDITNEKITFLSGIECCINKFLEFIADGKILKEIETEFQNINQNIQNYKEQIMNRIN